MPYMRTALPAYAHCFTCGKDLLVASNIAKRLAEKGIALFRFDFTGLGHSGGQFCDTNFSTNIEDLVKAAEYMRTHLEAPKILIGHSLGGAAVLKAAPQIEESTAVVTIAAPADVTHVKHNFKDHEAEILRDGQALVRLSGRPFTIKKQFLEDLDAHSVNTNIADLKRALLVMHAPMDNTVGIENAEHIFTQAKHPKSFVTLGSADHLLLRDKADAEYAATVIAAWVQKYI